MSASITYILAFLFTILLFLSYAAIDQQYYYSNPIDASPDLGSGLLPSLFLYGAVQIGNVTLQGYELAATTHAPMSRPNEDQDKQLNGTIRTPDELDDKTACLGLEFTDFTDSIALVQRGKCSLFRKIANCQAQGAKAVLISEDGALNDAKYDEYIDPVAVSRVPALILAQSDYDWLLAHTEEEASVWTLTPNVDLSMLRIFVLLFIRPVIMLTIVLLLVFINFHGKKAKKRSSPDLVWSLPRRQWDPASEGVWHQRQCSICLEDFSEQCEIMTLPCSHEFHVSCVSQWLLRRRGVCPLCFQEVEQTETTPLLQN